MKPGDALITLACQLGYAVTFVDEVKRRASDKPVPDGYYSAGYTDYERRTIQIVQDSAPAMFLVLAHEVGHALAAHRMGIDRRSARARRYARTGEARAYLYGWSVLRLVGMAPHPITRELWRDEHRDIVPGLPDEISEAFVIPEVGRG